MALTVEAADGLSQILTLLPDRTKARCHCETLDRDSLRLISSFVIDHLLQSAPKDKRIIQLLYVWQIVQVALGLPASSPPGDDRNLNFLLPLAQWQLSHLLADVNALTMLSKLNAMVGQNVIDFLVMKKLLKMNIINAVKKEYNVKVRVLSGLLESLEKHERANSRGGMKTGRKAPPPSASAPPPASTNSPTLATAPPSASSSASASFSASTSSLESESASSSSSASVSTKSSAPSHAPVFLNVDTTTTTTPTATETTTTTPPPILDGATLLTTGCGSMWRRPTGSIGKNKSSKKDRRRKKQSLQHTAISLSNSLDTHGFAAIDHFATMKEIQSLRNEIQRLSPHTEPSQIWVGKTASVGAHVVLPHVRGDKVLWMCGGHGRRDIESNLFDSAGIQPSTRGEIEPCDPTVRAATTFDGRFVHLRSLLKRLDELVYNGLKSCNDRLRGVSSRSDAMLACYEPGDRFQQHVDNTAGDGRRLTCLVYMNMNEEGKKGEKGEKGEKGGYLRLHGVGKQGESVDLEPVGGRLVLFWSDRVSHEVREQKKGERWALTVWYFDFGERMRAVMDTSMSNASSEENVNDAESQIEAQKFVEKLLEDCDDHDHETRLSELKRAATELTPDALCVLARVFFGKIVKRSEESGVDVGGNENIGSAGERVTTEDVLASLLSLDVGQYVELRRQARDMYSGKER